jgi:hypothetical protein
VKEAAACFRESIGLREEFVHSFKGVRETPTYLVVVQGCRSTIVMSPIRINVAWRYIHYVITRDFGYIRVVCAFDSAGDVEARC